MHESEDATFKLQLTRNSYSWCHAVIHCKMRLTLSMLASCMLKYPLACTFSVSRFTLLWIFQQPLIIGRRCFTFSSTLLHVTVCRVEVGDRSASKNKIHPVLQIQYLRYFHQTSTCMQLSLLSKEPHFSCLASALAELANLCYLSVR